MSKTNSHSSIISKNNNYHSLKMKSYLNLYDWQQKALDCWYKNKFGVIEASTGSGKTWIALEILKEHQDCKFLIIVPKRSLADQWREKIYQLTKLKTYFLSSSRFNTQTGIVVEVVNSVINNIDTIVAWSPDIIIYDEVHRYTGQKFKQALEIKVIGSHGHPCGKLGLTATMPNKKFDSYSYDLITANVGEVIYKYSISDAKEDELIAPYSLFVSHVGLTIQEQKELLEINSRIMVLKNQIVSILKSKGIKFDLSKVLQQKLSSEYSIPEVQQLRYSYLQRRHLNYKARFKIYNGCLTIEKILKKLPHEQIMIYTMSIKVAQEISGELDRKDITNKTIHSKNDPYDNECAIKSFKAKDLTALISVRTLDEGIDIPHIRFVIIIANSKQIRQLIQRLGRTLRIDTSNPNKQSYIVLFEVDGDEFDMDDINKGATNSFYFDVNEINNFYNKLTEMIA